MSAHILYTFRQHHLHILVHILDIRPKGYEKGASLQNPHKHNIRIRLFWNCTSRNILTIVFNNIPRLISVAFEMDINLQWYDKETSSVKSEPMSP
jgi:hypothetical protein